MSKETIRRLVVDEPPTPQEADYFNEVVDYLNAVIDLKTSGLSWKITRSIAELELDEIAVAQAAASIFPFALRDASNTSGPRVSVTLGKVNGIIPTITGVPITSDAAALTFGFAGQFVVWLRAQISDDALTYGDLETVEVRAGFAAEGVPEPTFENPTLEIGSFDVEQITDDTGTRYAVTNIRNAVFSDLQLVRFYADYVWTANNNGGAA